jgi:hypothetical protein
MSIHRRDGQPRMQKPVREEPFASLEANGFFVRSLPASLGLTPHHGAPGSRCDSQSDELLNLVQGKTQFLGALDKAKALNSGFWKGAIASKVAVGFRQESSSFVVPNDINVDTSPFGDGSDGHRAISVHE